MIDVTNNEDKKVDLDGIVSKMINKGQKMKEQKFYEYWTGENTPSESPKDCEKKFSNNCNWLPTQTPIDRWDCDNYRWPVPEYIWRTNRYCEAFSIDLKDPKYSEYEVVGFGHELKTGECFLNESGIISTYPTSGFKPILRKKEEWITPTDEDAKLRPICEMWDFRANKWVECDRKLVFVDIEKHEDDRRFYLSDGASIYRCRVKKSELERLRNKKGGE